MSVSIMVGDCLVRMKELADNSVDSVVCDPPYHLTQSNRSKPPPHIEGSPYSRHRMGVNGDTKARRGFMNQTWDGGDVAFRVETWAEVLRVLKPGGHLVAFSGTRTYHRMAVAIEDAGFEVRDMISWIYGSGFPKSLSVSKAIDRMAGAEREVIGSYEVSCDFSKVDYVGRGSNATSVNITAPATAAAREWDGWGSALKPALEPCCLARKPLSEKSIAANVLKWGTGALNIDGCRIAADEELRRNAAGGDNGLCDSGTFKIRERRVEDQAPREGRWPANLCHDGSDEVVAGFPASDSSEPRERTGSRQRQSGFHMTDGNGGFGDSGSAARFFYTAKASSSERGDYCNHPTVKPIALMRWLCRLVTPKGGTILDPFAGSGSTLIAADAEQFNAIGIELSPEYAAIAERRVRDAAGMFADVEVAA